MSLWTQHKYPGDTVRILQLKRGDEVGDVRIQHYGNFLSVGSFLPGNVQDLPGDTPKVWPEKSETCYTSFKADEAFDRLAQEAYAEGWQNG